MNDKKDYIEKLTNIKEDTIDKLNSLTNASCDNKKILKILEKLIDDCDKDIRKAVLSIADDSSKVEKISVEEKILNGRKQIYHVYEIEDRGEFTCQEICPTRSTDEIEVYDCCRFCLERDFLCKDDPCHFIENFEDYDYDIDEFCEDEHPIRRCDKCGDVIGRWEDVDVLGELEICSNCEEDFDEE